MDNFIVKLESAFSHIQYYDPKHTYTDLHTGENLKSVTTYINSLKEPFDSEYWSLVKAFEASGYKVKAKDKNSRTFVANDILYTVEEAKKVKLEFTTEKLLEDWDEKRESGTNRGSYLHLCLEKLNKRELITSPLQLGATSNLEDISILIQLANNFKKENPHLIPVISEFVVGDSKLKLAGRFDQLYFNLKTNNYEIWDYKTDKKFRTSNFFSKLKVFNIDDCEFEKYSLQTSLYKYIIEKNTKIKLGQSNIVHFNYKDEVYNIIPVNDYTTLIHNTLNHDDWTTYF